MLQLDEFLILIPARKGSKRLPYKNRALFNFTAKIIPDSFKDKVFVSSNDNQVLKQAEEHGFNLYKRKSAYGDTATTKQMIQDFIENNEVSEKKIIMLYLTYPQRSWEDIVNAVNFYNNSSAKSLLCKKRINSSPYLMMYDLPHNKGAQIIEHDLCRSQDYRKCFEISHFVAIFDISEVENLNNNIYNNNTVYIDIRNVIDVDTKEDLEGFYG